MLVCSRQHRCQDQNDSFSFMGHVFIQTSVFLLCSHQGGWYARGEEQEHRTGSGKTPSTRPRRLHHTLNSQELTPSVCAHSKIVVTRTASLRCERNHVADDYSPFSCRFIMGGEQTLGERRDIRLSTRAAVQIRPFNKYNFTPIDFRGPEEANALSLLCNRRLFEAGLDGGIRVTSAADPRLRILSIQHV